MGQHDASNYAWSISRLQTNLLVTLLDGHYSIVARELIAVETRFAEMAQSLPHLAAARSRSTEDLALRTPARAGLLEVVVADRTWPSCSPFVDPHRVRVCLAVHMNGGGKSCGSQREGTDL